MVRQSGRFGNDLARPESAYFDAWAFARALPEDCDAEKWREFARKAEMGIRKGASGGLRLYV
jgi:hypothetical protein